MNRPDRLETFKQMENLEILIQSVHDRLGVVLEGLEEAEKLKDEVMEIREFIRGRMGEHYES